MSQSENGWQPAKVGQDALQWVTIPGTDVNIQFMSGWPMQVLRAFAADFNAYVEPLRDRDSASWTPTNSVPTSNHLNGTAMDLNWDSHPFRVKGTFTAAQVKTIRELLAFYEDTVFWAGDWTDPIDEMHWQMGYQTFNNPAVGDFIKRKIRPDGFSTFRRDAAKPPVPPTVPGKPLDALSPAEQRELLDLVRQQSGYRRVSRSPLRRVGERETETIAGFGWNTDGNVHVLLIKMLAELGDPDALNLLREVANLDPVQYPDRAHDRLLAQAILNAVAGIVTVGSAPPVGITPGITAAPVVAAEPAPAAPEPVRVVQVPDTPEPSVTDPAGGMQTQVDALHNELATLRGLLAALTTQIRS